MGNILLICGLAIAFIALIGSSMSKKKSRNQKQEPKPSPKPAPVVHVTDGFTTEKQWKDYFREILRRRFPEYAVAEEVPVIDLTGDVNDVFKLYKNRPNQVYKAEWGRPYDFVLSADGKNKAVIMLGSVHSHNENVKYLIARMFAKKLGLAYIGFYTQFPNDEEYVVKRIKECMNN